MAVDPIEEWLGTRLKAAYPVDDWVLEGVTSALLLMEDRADAVDTIANFLGTADAPGTNEQIVDELFRRKRGDATGAGAGENQSRASEPATSSAGPSRDASSARARATSSSDAHEARVDVAEKKKEKRRRASRRRLRENDAEFSSDHEKKRHASSPRATRGAGEKRHQLPGLR